MSTLQITENERKAVRKALREQIDYFMEHGPTKKCGENEAITLLQLLSDLRAANNG